MILSKLKFINFSHLNLRAPQKFLTHQITVCEDPTITDEQVVNALSGLFRKYRIFNAIIIVSEYVTLKTFTYFPHENRLAIISKKASDVSLNDLFPDKTDFHGSVFKVAIFYDNTRQYYNRKNNKAFEPDVLTTNEVVKLFNATMLVVPTITNTTNLYGNPTSDLYNIGALGQIVREEVEASMNLRVLYADYVDQQYAETTSPIARDDATIGIPYAFEFEQPVLSLFLFVDRMFMLCNILVVITLNIAYVGILKFYIQHQLHKPNRSNRSFIFYHLLQWELNGVSFWLPSLTPHRIIIGCWLLYSGIQFALLNSFISGILLRIVNNPSVETIDQLINLDATCLSYNPLGNYTFKFF